MAKPTGAAQAVALLVAAAQASAAAGEYAQSARNEDMKRPQPFTGWPVPSECRGDA